MARTKRLNPTTAVRGLASHAMVMPLTDSGIDALASLRKRLDEAQGKTPGPQGQWTTRETETFLHRLSLGFHAAHPVLEGAGMAVSHGAAFGTLASGLGYGLEIAGGATLAISLVAEPWLGLSEAGQAHREGQALSTMRSVVGAYSAAYADEIARIAVARLEGGSEPVPLWDTSRMTTGGLQLWQVLGWYDAHAVLNALGDKATEVLDTLVDAYATREGIETALRGVVIDTCLQTAEPDVMRMVKGSVGTSPDRSAKPADFAALTETLGMTAAPPPSPVLPAQGGAPTAPPGEPSWWTDETRSTPADDGLTSPITSEPREQRTRPEPIPIDDGLTSPITSEPREQRTRPEPIPIDDGLTSPLDNTRSSSSERLEPPPDDQLTSDLDTTEQPGDDDSRWYWPEETPAGGADQTSETYVEQADEETFGVDETALDQDMGPISTPEGVTWAPPPRSMNPPMAPPVAGPTDPYTPQPLPQSLAPTYEAAETTYQTSTSQDFTDSTRPPDYEQSRPDQATFEPATFEQPGFEHTTESAFVQEVAPEELFEQDDEIGEDFPPQYLNEPPG